VTGGDVEDGGRVIAVSSFKLIAEAEERIVRLRLTDEHGSHLAASRQGDEGVGRVA